MTEANVSVVIPLYNGERWIEETLRSVLSQTHRPREIVVVDDGSDDDSPSIVRSFAPEVKLVSKPGEGGQGAGPARNFGLQRTSAPFVAFLDQDDLWHPDHLRVLAPLLKNTNYPAAIGGLEHFTGSSGPSFKPQLRKTQIFSPWDRFPINDIFSPSCAVVRRSALEAIGGWPVQFMLSDYNAWLKVSTLAPMVRTTAITTAKRKHERSALNTIRDEEALSLFLKLIEICEDALAFREEMKAVEKVFRSRLNALKAIGGVLEGVVRNDSERVAASAQRLEQENSIGREMEKSLWDWTFWAVDFQRRVSNVRQQRLFLEPLIPSWPNAYGVAGDTLSEKLIQEISYKGFLSFALHHPIQAATSSLFHECMEWQFAKIPRVVRNAARRPALAR